MSYFKELKRILKKRGRYEVLGQKVKRSGMPICIMGGALAEVAPTTLQLKDRDPRATMNAMHHSEACSHLLELAAEFDIPLLFIPDHFARKIFKMQNADDVIEALSLEGTLKDMAERWYGEHLSGKCTMNDWVAFCAQLTYKRYPQVRIESLKKQWILPFCAHIPSSLPPRSFSSQSRDFSM